MAHRSRSRFIQSSQFALIVCLFLWGAGNAFGQVKTIRSLSTPVSPGSKTTYSDLVKLVFPDLSPEDGAAHETISLRHVSGDHERMALHGDFKIDSFESIQIHDSEGPLVVIEIDVTTDDDSRATAYGADSSIVAAFRIAPSVKLLDALDVKTDRFTGIMQKTPLIRIAPTQSAFLISNSHSNSNQSYELISGFFIRNRRLQPLFTSPPTRPGGRPAAGDLFLLDDRGFDDKSRCEVATDEIPTFLSSPQPGKPYYKVGVRVRVTRTAGGDECKSPKRRSTYYRGGWEWDDSAKRFSPSAGGNLEVLDKLNEGRM
jgi:hypothetical protein